MHYSDTNRKSRCRSKSFQSQIHNHSVSNIISLKFANNRPHFYVITGEYFILRFYFSVTFTMMERYLVHSVYIECSDRPLSINNLKPAYPKKNPSINHSTLVTYNPGRVSLHWRAGLTVGHIDVPYAYDKSSFAMQGCRDVFMSHRVYITIALNFVIKLVPTFTSICKLLLKRHNLWYNVLVYRVALGFLIQNWSIYGVC